jgi:hypothetical protein
MKRLRSGGRVDLRTLAAAGAKMAMALGALAIGALAVRWLGIGWLAVGKARIGALEIGELKVDRLRAGDLSVTGVLELPAPGARGQISS